MIVSRQQQRRMCQLDTHRGHAHIHSQQVSHHILWYFRLTPQVGRDTIRANVAGTVGLHVRRKALMQN
jgi:hypothetical protein